MAEAGNSGRLDCDPVAEASEAPSAGSGGTAAPRAAQPSVRITRDDVAHLARLARLAVTDAELDQFAGQLEVILSSVSRVAEVAASDISPTSHVVALENVYRRDEVRPSLSRTQVLAGAPAVEDDKFRVPRILGESS